MNLSGKVFKRAQLIIPIIALLYLVVITIANQKPPLFDEILFVRNMTLFEDYGISKKFLLEMYDQAPGPLYQFVHYLCEPLTHYQTPGIRVVNVLMFVGVILISLILMRNEGYSNYQIAGLNLVAVPVIWQSAGMALTEMPALFFLTMYLLVLQKLLKQSFESWYIKVGLAILSGFLLGLTILGRTPYLVLVPALWVSIIDFENKRIKANLLISSTLISIIALSMSLPVFVIWEGLVPPAQRLVSDGGISPWHGVLAFAYSGIVAAIINPSWFSFHKSQIWYLVLGYVILFVANKIIFKVTYGPLSAVVKMVFPDKIFEVYLYAIAPVLMLLAVCFLLTLLGCLFKNQNERFYLYSGFCLILLLLSCLKINHLFSTRYVAQASVFLVLIVSKNEEITFGKIVRTLVGIIVGYFSLETYISGSY